VTTMRRCAWCQQRFRSADDVFCSSICSQASARFHIAASLQEFARKDAAARLRQPDD
jgi:hypothetical protein